MTAWVVETGCEVVAVQGQIHCVLAAGIQAGCSPSPATNFNLAQRHFVGTARRWMSCWLA